MKLHGLSIPEMGNSQQKLSTVQTQKSVHFEKTINGTEDHNDHSSNITSSTKIPLHSTPNLPPTHANDKDRDKAFGKMSHYVNELKKELDSAAKARKEHGLETQRLRERCIQLEEKLQSEKSKNSLLEEQLEKSLKKQRELQAQLDALHSSHQSSLPIQSVTGVDITQQQHPPPPLGTPNGTSSSKSQTVSLGTNVPSASMPSKSNSASNIPSLCVAGFVNHDLSASVTSQQALNSTSTPASAGNTPRISNGYATIGSTLHENPQSLPTSSNLPVDSQLIPQSDEFENFIASRSAPIVEEWTDTSASLTI